MKDPRFLAVVMTGETGVAGAALTVSLNDLESSPATFEAVAVKLYSPASEMLPESRPSSPKFKPSGRFSADHFIVQAVPSATSCFEMSLSAVKAPRSSAVVIEGAVKRNAVISMSGALRLMVFAPKIL